MIGSAYKKFAEELALKQTNGVACGEVDGFMTTLSEGMGFKEIFISLVMPDYETQIKLEKMLVDRPTMKEYRIMQAKVTDSSIFVSFSDRVGSMKRIRDFRDWFFPILKMSGVMGTSHCPECKQAIASIDRTDKLINQRAYTFHKDCAARIAEAAGSSNEIEKAEKANAGRGFIGALIGGVLGAIPWAIVYAMGWFVGWLGLIMGLLAHKGYTLFGGKLKKSTIFVLIIPIVLSVVFAQLLGECFSLGYMIQQGELPGLRLSDIPYLMTTIVLNDSEYVQSFLSNVALGLFFAALGVSSLFMNLFKEASAKTVKIDDID